MQVLNLDVRDLRSLEHIGLELGPGITSVVGDNGTGKTNLLEAIHFGLSGRSFRTRDRRELIRFGESVARAELRVLAPERTEHSLLGSVSRAEGRRHLLDGEAAPAETIARHRPQLLVFIPDRLILVKGPPAERRAHVDGFVVARWPARSGLRQDYARALAQRNALLHRVSAGLSPEAELDAWDGALAEVATPLIEARAEAVAELSLPFAAAAEELGLEAIEIRYQPRSEAGAEDLRAALAERRASDLQRARTSLGPHLDEIKLTAAGRSLRRYGSQGEQRAGLLALLFAEREALIAADSPAPLMLLDDVMSELDPAHRELLGSRLANAGQSLISAADEGALPEVAAQRIVRMPSGSTAGLKAVA